MAQRARSEGKVLSATGLPHLWGPSFLFLDPLDLRCGSHLQIQRSTWRIYDPAEFQLMKLL